MSQQGLAPRRAAARLIDGVTIEHRLLSELLPGPLAALSPEGRARSQRLATECLRMIDRCDRMLGPYLRNKPDDRAMTILRLGTYEICAGGGAAHGVVNDCVALIKEDEQLERLSGLVNAVLRNVARNVAKWDALPVPRLPKWLRKVLLADYGKATVEAIERVHAAQPPLDLTAKGDAAALAERLGGTVTPTGSVRLAGAGQVSALDGYEAGDWWVQDAAAAVPARVLNAQPGERVLDLCAAPGGKAMQLAASGAAVTALDISARRMARVEENLARTGLSAEIVVADALTYEAAPFDAILLDAPCTATGTIRRHPDLPQAKDGGDFPALFALQESMIDKALGLLKPGGRLVFCTCSLLIDEGEEQVRDAKARHPDLIVDTGALAIPGIEPDWIGPEGLRLRPDFRADAGGMDGFFVTMLRKPA